MIKMIRNNSLNVLKFLLGIVLLIIAFSACDNDLETVDEQTKKNVGINFFTVSETFMYYENSNPKGVGIFIDTAEYHVSINQRMASIPHFDLDLQGYKSWFPYNYNFPGNNQPLYMISMAGNHRLIFSYFTYELVNDRNTLSRPSDSRNRCQSLPC